MTNRIDVENALPACDSCGSESLRIVHRMSEYVSGDIRVSYPDEITTCEACGDSFYSRAQMENRSRSITAAISEAQRLFTPLRIKRARTALNMSQAQFEQALGLGKKTVGRWERGTVPPSQAANFALWVAEQHPRVVMEYSSAGSAHTSAPDDRSIIGHILPSSVGPIKIMNTERTGKLSSSLSPTNRDTLEPVTTNARESMFS